MKRLLIIHFSVCFLLSSCVNADINNESAPFSPENYESSSVTSQTYEVVFTFDWNANDFPTDYPSGTHFSQLVGWVHQSNNTLFSEGEIASDGIEEMAEFGGTSTLVTELQSFIDQGQGQSTYTGSGLNSGVGNITIDIEVSTLFSFVTLFTMIAPSPDWYVGCLNTNLFDENNEFVSEKTIVGTVFDAGTDSGETFTSANSDTQPPSPIQVITTPPLAENSIIKPSFCMITFTKK